MSDAKEKYRANYRQATQLISIEINFVRSMQWYKLPFLPLGQEECSAAASAKAAATFSLVEICFFNFVLHH